MAAPPTAAWLLVPAAGAVGTLLRMGMQVAAVAAPLPKAIPVGWSTLAVNAIGSLAIAWMTRTFDSQSTWAGVEIRLILGTGVLGGFTTYSGFNNEILALAGERGVPTAALYAASMMTICIVFGALGMRLG